MMPEKIDNQETPNVLLNKIDKSMLNNLERVSVLERERDSSLDFAKLIATLFVVLCHSLMQYVTDCGHNPLMNLIWLIQMPLFMVVSGILSPKQEKLTSIKSFFYRTGKNFLYSIIPFITCLLIRLTYVKAPIKTTIANAFLDPESNLWFLWVLFFIKLFFEFGLYLSSKCKNKIMNFITPICTSALVVIILFLISLIFKIDLNLFGAKFFCYYMPFFCLGYLLKHFKQTQFYKSDKNYKIYELIAFIVCFAIVLFYIFYFDSIMDFDDNNISYLIIRILGSAISVFFTLILCKYAIKLEFFKKIAWAGKFSLECYYLHTIFIQLFTLNLFLPSISDQWLSAFMCFSFLVISVSLSLALIYFIPFLHLILFGKSYSFYEFERNAFKKLIRKTNKT